MRAWMIFANNKKEHYTRASYKTMQNITLQAFTRAYGAQELYATTQKLNIHDRTCPDSTKQNTTTQIKTAPPRALPDYSVDKKRTTNFRLQQGTIWQNIIKQHLVVLLVVLFWQRKIIKYVTILKDARKNRRNEHDRKAKRSAHRRFSKGIISLNSAS